MRELAQALEVALELLLSQAVPLPRGVLIGLGQHGAELRDRFHVLPGLPGQPFAVLPCRALAEIGQLLDPGAGSIAVLVALLVSPGLLADVRVSLGGCHLFCPKRRGFSEAQLRGPPLNRPALEPQNRKTL